MTTHSYILMYLKSFLRMKTVTDLILLGSKIAADSDCSHEIKRYSLEEKL